MKLRILLSSVTILFCVLNMFAQPFSGVYADSLGNYIEFKPDKLVSYSLQQNMGIGLKMFIGVGGFKKTKKNIFITPSLQYNHLNL